VGGVLLVARRNKTLIDDIQLVAEQVTQAGAKVVGSVLVDF
jgi:protein-tyrosine kinase